jgi:hypothetical protein
MLTVLANWCGVITKEYPDVWSLLPKPNGMLLHRLEGGGIMTDTYNSAQKTRPLLIEEITGNIYNLLRHNHLHSVWIKTALDLLTDFLRTHITDSLNKVVLRFQVNPGFDKLIRTFDKMFSLTMNYPKGWG